MASYAFAKINRRANAQVRHAQKPSHILARVGEIGKLTEDEFQLLEGGVKPSKGITTSDGKRYFDNVLDDVAREVKSGPVTLSKYKDQIVKDIEILKQDLTGGKINKIEWHCFDEVDKVAIDNFVKQELGDKSNLFQIIIH